MQGKLPGGTTIESAEHRAANARWLTRGAFQSIDSIGRVRNVEGRPLYVVTLDTLPAAAAGAGIEEYARAIYDDWHVGSNLSVDQGVLLLVVAREQRAAIALGPGWSSSARADAQRLVEQVVNPAPADARVADAVNAGVRALSSGIASRNPWIGRGLAFIPVFAVGLAWLSYARIRNRVARREAERDAVFAKLGSRMIARQEATLRAVDGAEPVSRAGPPS